ncbi:hypothetical protein TNIN_61531 [Trichonephila inaurata madagascariensis]|uniref:Uncharacterized protein n=1 Tax=Trichonephila inaurata madagascariensis TaxID=2747483 RepID=A0A8X6XF05_9ARAC|nr:hypothetical protein TNIN_61531 [Trichonephila inaurata madagascariensis]
MKKKSITKPLSLNCFLSTPRREKKKHFILEDKENGDKRQGSHAELNRAKDHGIILAPEELPEASLRTTMALQLQKMYKHLAKLIYNA